MKAITLHQPWASLIIMGAKKFETKNWKTYFRGPLLIHASPKLPSPAASQKLMANPYINKFIKDINILPFGAVIGKCELVGIYPTEDISNPATIMNIMLTDQEKAFGDFSPGRYVWGLDEIVQFKNPLPHKGTMWLWEFPNKLLPKE